MLLLLRCGLLLIGLCGATAAPALRQEPEQSESVARSSRPIERLRERLRALPAGERVRLERHLDEFEKLPKARRAKLLERARALRERERSLDAAVTRELRRRLQEMQVELGAARAGELWRALLRESFRELGREVRARLPQDFRRWLEQASPELRRRYLERLAEERERLSRKALVKLRERSGLPAREIQRLERLPLAERLHALRALREPGRDRSDG